MSNKVLYKWKDNRGNVKSSWGIALTIEEQQQLCRKNMRLIREQQERAK